MTHTFLINHQFYKLYVLCLAMTLPLHVFNLGGGDGLKPFHVPALASCLLSFKIIPKRGGLYRVTMLFLFFAFTSAVLSFSSSAFPYWLNTFIIITSCQGLAYVNPWKIMKWLLYVIPFVVLILFLHGISDISYRYQGFYSDPNYLCTTLIAFLLALNLEYPQLSDFKWKWIIVSSLIMIYALIIMTVSRTGMACGVLILLVMSFNAMRKHSLMLIIGVFLGLIALQNYATDFVEQEWKLIYDRVFKASDDMENASDYRLELSMQNIYFIKDNPEYFFFGLGGGTTVGTNAEQVPGLATYRTAPLGDHNSWTSTLSEQGLVCVTLFALFMLLTLKNILRVEDRTRKYMMLTIFVSILIFSFSISQKNYLPFWWILFFLNNRTLRHKSI